jgi:starch synthase
LPDGDVPIYLIDQPDYFDRDNLEEGRSLYSYTREDGAVVDYPDNCERFVFFCRAVLEALRLIDFWPDVIHCNDWHTGLVPVYLREVYARHAAAEHRPRYRYMRTLLTIHNIAYQGIFWSLDFPILGLPWELFNYRQLEFHGNINFLKAGIVFSDRITAVSPSYAREIQTSTYGAGLQGVLSERRKDLLGIVNGVDYRTWNPATDSYIAANYGAASVEHGKHICKRDLQRRLGLPEQERTPLIGMISRLVAQKGLELIERCADKFLQEDVQFAVLGQGDPYFKSFLLQLQERFPGRVAVRFGMDEALAHQIEAGADMFLMPSLFEPCGLNQLYSLKYGTVPIVRRTGGLADTVVDATPENLTAGTATGFSFAPPGGFALLETIHRALAYYQAQPAQWLEIMHTGMRQDWSWEKSAGEYERVYERLVNGE